MGVHGEESGDGGEAAVASSVKALPVFPQHYWIRCYSAWRAGHVCFREFFRVDVGLGRFHSRGVR